MKELTQKQADVLEFITDQKIKGTVPSVYEISDHFNVKTSTMFRHLEALVKKGKLTKNGRARSYNPTDLIFIVVADKKSGQAIASAMFRKISQAAKYISFYNEPGFDIQITDNEE